MTRLSWILPIVFALPLTAREAPTLPPELSEYVLDPAPEAKEPLLRKGDRLAIIGDSITEQKRYSVIIETYITGCLPELEVTTRQYGWSGERAEGFIKRMENDVLRFKPTIATSCYGMNDFRYVPFDQKIADEYRRNQTTIVQAFKKAGSRFVVGSPGIIDSVPHWVKTASGTKKDLNLSLSKFRNVALEVAKAENVGFADVYQPMLIANQVAQKKYGGTFMVAGKDGVHPLWAGHTIMAYAFLKGLGVDGDLGTITYDEASGKAIAVNGHEILSSGEGKVTLRSTKLPFSCAPKELNSDDSITAARALIPFDDDLNRLTLKLNKPKAASYDVTWGETTKRYTAAELTTGVNLAKDFAVHPLSAPFRKIWEAVTDKQTYETEQIKKLVHGAEGKADMEGTFEKTEKVRAEKVAAIAAARQPVEHSVLIKAAE
ncbi:MAG: SGNH/GDSL hydrolase family protein [Akkermansiaceae bacterium]|nr:SGNH/GDSL hydrolase family protein [Akkermansiaceae bacterium]